MWQKYKNFISKWTENFTRIMKPTKSLLSSSLIFVISLFWDTKLKHYCKLKIFFIKLKYGMRCLCVTLHINCCANPWSHIGYGTWHWMEGWIFIAFTLPVHQKQVWKGLAETCDLANVYLVKKWRIPQKNYLCWCNIKIMLWWKNVNLCCSKLQTQA